MDKLIEGLRLLNFSSEKLAYIAEKADKYIKEIILFNSAYNITNTSGYDEIVVKHVLDSLSAYTAVLESAQKIQKAHPHQKITIADIGSGGGLPGIPLALAMPEYDFVLVERMDKRCAFLENEVSILGLNNVNIMKCQAEQIKSGSFEICVFRAFRPLEKKIIKTLLSITKNNGFLCAYKAKESAVKAEMEKIKDIIPPESYKIIPLFVPFLTGRPDDGLLGRERNLVLINKF